MTRAANQQDNEMRGQRSRLGELGLRNWWPGQRRRRAITVTAALLGLVVMAAGCGGSKPGGGGTAAGGSSAGDLAYARCMRSHGISDFPDPSPSLGGGAIETHGGPGSDLDPTNPRFRAANQACRSLIPGGSQAPAQSAAHIAAEVKWAQCLRSHGLPSFPDPNGQGAFDSSQFDESSPAFQSASKACQSLTNAAGSVSAVPGHGGSGG
jgi:hypothetical protein